MQARSLIGFYFSTLCSASLHEADRIPIHILRLKSLDRCGGTPCGAACGGTPCGAVEPRAVVQHSPCGAAVGGGAVL